MNDAVIDPDRLRQPRLLGVSRLFGELVAEQVERRLVARS
jgi:hypothetical protein